MPAEKGEGKSVCEHSPRCLYGAAAVGVGGGSSGRVCECCPSWLRRPAFLLALSETTGFNTVSTRQRDYCRKTVVTQTQGLPEMRLFRSEVQAVPEPAGAGGGWQGFRLCVV